MQYQVSQVSRLGNRENNQDRCLVVETDDATLLVVADGMGGHARGDLAAQTFVDTLRRQFAQRDPLGDPGRFLLNAFEIAHRTILAVGQSQRPPIQPMTTAVACVVQGDSAHWAHVGDSRLYLLRNQRIFFQTRDHTPVADMVAAGLLTDRQAKQHPLRNQVSRCIGGYPTTPDVTLGPTAFLQSDDVLLLCSDGLWSPLGDAALLELLEHDSVPAALDDLAMRAEQQSYPRSDNVSGVAFRWEGLGDQAEARPRRKPAPDNTTPGDPLNQAIAELERALEEYGDEMQGNASTPQTGARD